jgi:hypothetical protein
MRLVAVDVVGMTAAKFLTADEVCERYLERYSMTAAELALLHCRGPQLFIR